MYISHDMAVVRYMADRIAVMYVGKIVEYADRDELLENPAHPYTEALQSAVPGRKRKRVDRIILKGNPPDPSNLPKGCIFQNRCRYEEDICREQEPELNKVQ